MGNGVHIPQKSKVRKNRKKPGQEITLVSGKYVNDFFIALFFTSGGGKSSTILNFLPLFQKYVKGDNLKYFAPGNFKKYIIKNGNIYWGKNEDVIFSGASLLQYNKNVNEDDEILYII